ncbi:MAG TPA: heavy metal-associated domain-containing protein [bacterium]|nr:heavy metal-associated domain-containing protein [bacterium]
MATAIFSIQGMTCDHCVQTLQSVLSQVKGVKEARVSLKDRRADLTYEGGLEARSILDAVALAGYQAALTEVKP